MLKSRLRQYDCNQRCKPNVFQAQEQYLKMPQDQAFFKSNNAWLKLN